MFRNDNDAAQIAKAELEKDLVESRKEIDRLNRELTSKKQKEASGEWELWPVSGILRDIRKVGWKSFDVARLFVHTSTFRFFCLFVAACGCLAGFVYLLTQVNCTPSMTGGHVTNLYHHHSFTTHYTTCTGGTNNQPRVCTPHTIYHPEKWSAIVCDEGRCSHPYYSEEDWNTLHVGQWICLEPGCHTHPDREELYNRD